MAIWEDHIVGLERKAPGDLTPHSGNWRTHPDEQRSTMTAAFDEVGKVAPLIENLRSEDKGWPAGSAPVLLDGHLRLELALERGEDSLPVVVVDLTERQEALALATLDPIGAQAEADPELLAALLKSSPPESPDLGALLKGIVGEPPTVAGTGAGSLAERFGVPPFSVLDARQGYWQERKRAWLSLGIQSEIGRGGKGAYPVTGSASAITEGLADASAKRGGASPGGSPRPAMKLGKDGRTRRGDGKGRRING